MTTGLYIWSQTAASNGNADTSINWQEGQSPSTVNDSARAMMAGIAKYRDDIACGIATGGSSTAYTVTSNQVFDSLAHMHNQLVGFVPNATSTNAVAVDVTLNVDGLGAKPIRAQPSVTLPTGTLVSGTPYVVTYNNTDGVFYLHGMTNPYVVPVGSSLEYWGSSAPTSTFALMFGQAISRTTYATLFSLFSTTYGSGDGSTTFNIPDLRGRVTAGKDDMGGVAASRLSSTYFGGTATNLGATGGLESHTLTTAELPVHSHANSLSDPGHSHSAFGTGSITSQIGA